MPRNDPTATENPDAPAKSDRRRMTLSMSVAEYATLEKIAAFEHCSIMAAIKRSAQTRWRMHTARYPELEYPDLPPEQRPHPAHIGRRDEVTGEFTAMEIHT